MRDDKELRVVKWGAMIAAGVLFCLFYFCLIPDCKERLEKNIYPRTFQGRVVVNEYSEKTKSGITELSTGQSFTFCACSCPYVLNVKPGDSISKPTNSYLFHVFRGDSSFFAEINCDEEE